MSTGELIRNGSFEGPVSSADWTRTGWVASTGAQPHSGLGYAYLADASGNPGNNISGSLDQQVTIPPSAVELKLSFWTKITTNETTTTAQNDALTVKVTDASGANVLQSVATFSNLNASSSYIKRTFTLSSALKGQTVRIQFSGSTNATLGTTFRIDDVGLSTKLPDTAKKIVGYVPTYRQGLFAQMNLDYVTHVNYFAVKVNADGSLNTSAVSNANVATVVNAAHAKGVTVSITVGPQSFATVAADPVARANFATNIVNYCAARNLDGVDIDWEPPATGTNYANYALLMQALHDRITAAAPQLRLTAAVNPWTQEIPVAATNLMDWVNVMCYDFHYANNSTYEAAIDGMIQWSDYGVEKHKLLMGTPFYGRSGTSWSDTTSKTYGAFFNEYSALHGAPPAPTVDSFTDANGKLWYVSGQRTIQRKMAWVRDNGYGGAMIWELGQDHWDGANKYDQYSLLPVINSILRPPTWLAAGAGSMFNYVANTLSVAAGNVTFVGDAFASNPLLKLSVGTGATATFNLTQKLTGLTLSGTGTLNLKSNDLLLDYTGASPYATIRGYVIAGRTGGAGGIVTTATGDTTLGMADNALFGRTSWEGRSIDSTTIIGKYTYFGDANLDGKVTGDDYLAVDANLGRTIAQWFQGDFNFSGTVTGDDYLAVDANLGKGTSNPLALAEDQEQLIAIHAEQFGGDSYIKAVERAIKGDYRTGGAKINGGGKIG